MAQAFTTTYQKYYRQHPIERRKSLRPVDRFASELPEGGNWIVHKKVGEDDEGGVGLKAALAAIHKMNRGRLWTTYQMDYCGDMIAKEGEDEEQKPTGNAILIHGNKIYGPKTQQIPPPLTSARRIYGYIRPSRMYYPITTYEVTHGKVGYDVLLANHQATQKRQM
ncbi:hypothetical protein PPYR_12504 [Photinus pyralis]|uniref:Uncharacterized protein n=1 Tax=Photinus pyralis TaxID=7054 RepID=A0A5N4A6C3_PHOPY|nr:hypothetical protein PPYR_12504 [Photinus pyralis]